MFVGLGSQQFVLIRARGSWSWVPWGSQCFMSMEAFEKLQQLGASKLPGKVVGGEPLAVHDREVDCSLLEPTGRDRGGDQKQMRVGLGQAVSGRRAALR